MPKKMPTVTLKTTWKIGDTIIYHANAFQAFFTPYSCVLNVGFIGPEVLLPKPTDAKEKITEIKTLARFSLDLEAFQRLKSEIDKTYKKLKEIGALKDAK